MADKGGATTTVTPREQLVRARASSSRIGRAADLAARGRGYLAKGEGALRSTVGNATGNEWLQRTGARMSSFGDQAINQGLEPNMNGPAATTLGKRNSAFGDALDTNEARSKYQASLHAKRLATQLPPGLAQRLGVNQQARPGEPPRMNTTPEAQAAQRRIDGMIPESNRPRGTQEGDPATTDQIRAQLANLKLQRSRAKSQSVREELDRIKDEQIERLRRAVKRKAKAAFKRGIIYVIDLIAAALDMSSAGLSFIVDFFLYLFTFGWLNLEYFYGTRIAKKKSKIISPLSWDPIPVPVDPEANLLAGFIIAADIAIVLLGFGLAFAGLCLVQDYVQLIQDPFAFALSVMENPLKSCVASVVSGAL